MTTTLATVPGITTSPVGLAIDDDLEYGPWAEFGELLARAEGSYLWAVGDWMLYGAEHYGAKAVQLAAATGLTERTVWNATSVCKRVAIEYRRPELTFSHHDTVASLPADEQARWLDLAAAEGLSVSALRDQVAAKRERPALTADGKPRRVPVRFNVTCSLEVPAAILQEAVHFAAETLRSRLADAGYEIDIAEVL